MSNQSFLIFSIQDSLLAIDAHVVREIHWLPELTPIEEAPPYVTGVFNLRGKIIPVIDLAIRLGHASQQYHLTDNLIVTEIEERLTGMIVNEVHEVTSIPPEDIEELPLYAKFRVIRMRNERGRFISCNRIPLFLR